MDGASRFTQRDAIASIIITCINIVAGFLIGVFQHGMELQRALKTYTILTIGDGLVTVIPALMISVSGGLIVTRASSDSRLGAEVQKPNIQSVTASAFGLRGAVAVMAAFPGLPKIPFASTGRWVPAHFGWHLRTTKPQKVEGDSTRKGNRRQAEGGCRISPQNRASRN